MADSSFKINKGLTLNPQTSASTNPINGDIYYDSTGKSFVFYNNGQWQNLSSRTDIASAASLTSADFTSAAVQNSLVKLTGATAGNLHGLTATADAKSVVVYNQSTQTITIKHESATEATPANRVITATGNDVVVTSGQTVVFVYDSAQARWVLESFPLSSITTAQPMIGSAVGDTVDSAFTKTDAELAKLFEDRNAFLQNGGLITFTGTQIQFTETLELAINSKVAGGAPTVISLGSANRNLSATGRMFYAIIDRSLGTASIVDDATTLPSVTSANQEIFLIAKRVDAGDGTQRTYWRNGMAINAGQTVRLGASGSGSGSGTGDDLNSLQFQASFEDIFDESSTASLSAVNSTITNAAYSAAKKMYQISYDATKAASTVGTAATVSGTPAFTVVAGDVLISGGNVRKIVTVTTQTSYVLDAAFTPDLVAATCNISQAVHSKDIYGTAFDGSAISAAFSTSFNEILVDYEDTSTAGDDVFDIGTVPVVGFTASPDNTAWTVTQVRPTLETTQVTGVTLPSSGTALYFRWFANKFSGSGTVNILRYKAFMQRAITYLGGSDMNSALAFLDGVGTPVNCSISLLGGKSAVTLTFPYAVGVNIGKPYGSLDVYLNGQLIPRYIDATLTPDGSYTEISATVIKLDKDYSAINVSVEVVQRVTVIDTNTQNTTAIATLNANLTRFPTIQKFLSGSGTYTRPSSPAPLYIKVRMVGSGGGGGGYSGTATAGGNTTFGTSLLTANGGLGGAPANNPAVVATGGSVTVSAPAISIIALAGGTGGGSSASGTPTNGSMGGGTLLGEGGGGGGYTYVGNAALANSGGGGGGSGGMSGGAGNGGGGGGGGSIEAIITNPSLTYSYTIGTGGAGSTGGGGGMTGGTGGSGIIIVEEYYQ